MPRRRTGRAATVRAGDQRRQPEGKAPAPSPPACTGIQDDDQRGGGRWPFSRDQTVGVVGPRLPVPPAAAAPLCRPARTSPHDPRSFALQHAPRPLLARTPLGAPITVDAARQRLHPSRSRQGQRIRGASPACAAHDRDCRVRLLVAGAISASPPGRNQGHLAARRAPRPPDRRPRRPARHPRGDVCWAPTATARGHGGRGRSRGRPAAPRSRPPRRRGSSRSCCRSSACTFRARRRAPCCSTLRASGSRNSTPRR